MAMSSSTSLSISLDLCQHTVGAGEVTPSESDTALFCSFLMLCSMAVNLEPTLVRAFKMSWLTVSEVLTSVLMSETLKSESTLLLNWHFPTTGRLASTARTMKVLWHYDGNHLTSYVTNTLD